MSIVQTRKVRGSEADFTANLSVIGAFQIAQDCVTELMGSYQIDGLTIKRLYNAIWVFSKNRIKMLKPLVWGEEFTATAFFTASSLARIEIDVAVRNKAGELAAYARVQLCALDAETGRIRKTSTVGVDERIKCDPPECDMAYSSINVDALPIAESVTVRFTNIDFSCHTNNVEYLRFVLDTYTVDEIRKKPIKEVEVCYVNQSFEGEVLDVCKASHDNIDTLALRKSDGTLVVKCEIVF